MKVKGFQKRRRARIEVIPLIDIMFFLLATFVMVSLSMIKNEGIPVKLPSATTGAPHDHHNDITISIDESGRFFFDKTELVFESLKLRLFDLQKTAPETRIFINADANTSFQYVVSVLDEARKLGLTRIAIETSSTKQH